MSSTLPTQPAPYGPDFAAGQSEFTLDNMTRIRTGNSGIGRRRSKQQFGSSRGTAFLELALFAPWIFFLMIGAFDWGFYSYALICTQSAARVAAEYTSASPATAGDSSTACTLALNVMQDLPNVGTSTTSCSASGPVSVTATSYTASAGSTASKVSVTYQSNTLIPIPGLLTNQLTVTRSVIMRLRG